MRGVMAKKQRHVSEGYEACLTDLRTHISALPQADGTILIALGSNKQIAFAVAVDTVLNAAERAVKMAEHIKRTKAGLSG